MWDDRAASVIARPAQRGLRWWLLEALDHFLTRVWPFGALRAALRRHRRDRFLPEVARLNDWLALNAAARRVQDP